MLTQDAGNPAARFVSGGRFGDPRRAERVGRLPAEPMKTVGDPKPARCVSTRRMNGRQSGRCPRSWCGIARHLESG